MTKNWSFEGIVIKRTNLGEADRILSVFSKDHGKMALLARGVRKISSRRAGSIELFNLIRGQAIVGKNGLHVLGEVEIVHSFASWRKYLGRVTLAYQLCEVVDKLTGDDQPHPRVFQILRMALLHLGSLGDNWKVQMDSWLIEILVDLGFWSDGHKLEQDVFEYVESLVSRRMYSKDFLLKLH